MGVVGVSQSVEGWLRGRVLKCQSVKLHVPGRPRIWGQRHGSWAAQPAGMGRHSSAHTGIAALCSAECHSRCQGWSILLQYAWSYATCPW